MWYICIIFIFIFNINFFLHLLQLATNGCYIHPWVYHNKIRESICDYITYHSDRFKDRLPWDINEYIDRMIEDGEWGGEPEIFAFSEIYNTSVHVFDAMTSAIPYLVVEKNTSSHSINLLLTNKRKIRE